MKNAKTELSRVLTLKDLIIYGIVLIQPVAALPLFGHANNLSQGHAVTTILVAMVGMVFTAISYGKMARIFPEAGSAYTYVGKGLHPVLGFMSGWSMFLDYLLIPILCVVFTSITANHLVPFVPYPLWVLIFSIGFTALNLKGLQFTSKTNTILMVTISIVAIIFMVSAMYYISQENGTSALLSSQPFYNPESFSWSAIGSGTALAALTYIGFDGLTTLSEEVRNPKKNILIATVVTCLFTGIFSGLQMYFTQLSWPDWTAIIQGLTNEHEINHALDTAILSTANRVGGKGLDLMLSLSLLLASMGSGITAQIGASRLLFSMGRDNVLPKRFFGHLDSKSNPIYNIILVGLIAIIGAYLFSYEECAKLINFGAFLAFMGVNLACIMNEIQKKMSGFGIIRFLNFLFPSIGFLVCFLIWKSLPWKTLIIGSAWLVLGLAYYVLRFKAFSGNEIDVN